MPEDGNHTAVIPNLIASAIFSTPLFIFFFLRLYVFIALYGWAIVFLLVVVVSHVKWQNEIPKAGSMAGGLYPGGAVGQIRKLAGHNKGRDGKPSLAKI